MSQSHPTLMRYLKQPHGGKPAVARRLLSALDETALAYTASPSRLAF
jgi:hypothetical protein